MSCLICWGWSCDRWWLKASGPFLRRRCDGSICSNDTSWFIGTVSCAVISLNFLLSEEHLNVFVQTGLYQQTLWQWLIHIGSVWTVTICAQKTCLNGIKANLLLTIYCGPIMKQASWIQPCLYHTGGPWFLCKTHPFVQTGSCSLSKPFTNLSQAKNI